MTTEFTNIVSDVETILRHCFRVQAARCHEINLFSLFLFNKYPTRKNILPQVSIFGESKNLEGNSKFRIVIYQNCVLTEGEKEEYITKWARMMSAKRKFERLNGVYDSYRS